MGKDNVQHQKNVLVRDADEVAAVKVNDIICSSSIGTEGEKVGIGEKCIGHKIIHRDKCGGHAIKTIGREFKCVDQNTSHCN